MNKIFLLLLIGFVVLAGCADSNNGMDERDRGIRPLHWADAGRYKTFYFNPHASDPNLRITKITDFAVHPRGVAVDIPGGKIYFTANFTKSDGSIGASVYRSDLDGGNREELVAGLGDSRGIALDIAGGKMYYTDRATGNVYRDSLDGDDQETLITGMGDPIRNGEDPRGIALDIDGNKMYVVSPKEIYSADLDGNNREVFLGRDVINVPYGIALDPSARKMHWPGGNRVEDGVFNVRIYHVDLDTKRIETFDIDDTDDISENPLGVAVDVELGVIYWSDLLAKKIKYAKLDGSDHGDVVVSDDVPDGGGIRSPDGVALDIVPPGAARIVIHENNRVASLLMSSAEYEQWKEQRGSMLTELTKNTIYKRFSDDFDFITLILNETANPQTGINGAFTPIQNQVQNIGLQQYNNSLSYGSDDTLKGIVHLPIITDLQNGPSLHELMHTWGNYLIEGTEWNNGFATPTHWGVTGGSTRGQLGGFKQGSLRTDGTGGFNINGSLIPEAQYLAEDFSPVASGGNSSPYNEMELYLMGLISLDDVEPFDVFTGISGVTRYPPPPPPAVLTFNARTKVQYTPAKIRTDFGERMPLPATSQKAFKMLMIILTDRPLTDAQWTMLDRQAELFEMNGDDGDNRNYNFWEATAGLATIELGNLRNSIRR